MSNNEGSTATQTSTQDMHAAVGSIFDAFTAGGVQPRLRSVSGICQFDIAGAGTWRVTLKDGASSVTESSTVLASANCVVKCDAKDFLRIINREGNLNLFAAFLQGIVTFTGDLAFASTVLGSVIREPAGAASA